MQTIVAYIKVLNSEKIYICAWNDFDILIINNESYNRIQIKHLNILFEKNCLV